MLIYFNEIENLRREATFGGEGIFDAKIYNDGQNRIIMGTLLPGAKIGYHLHTEGSEMIYILSGKGKSTYDSEIEELVPGSCQYCPKGHSHDMVNDGTENLVFFAVVTKE